MAILLKHYYTLYFDHVTSIRPVRHLCSVPPTWQQGQFAPGPQCKGGPQTVLKLVVSDCQVRRTGIVVDCAV